MYTCIHVYIHTCMHASFIHSFVRSFIHSLIHSCMLGWMDGWMDVQKERERELAIGTWNFFACFASHLITLWVLGISKTCPISFMSTCFPMSVLAAVFWTMSSAYTLIQIYPNLSRVTTFRHLVGTLVATCHLSGDMFCPDWWCCHLAQHVFDCFCMHCVTWLSDRLPRYTGYGMSTGQPQVEHQTLLVAVAEHRDSITICQLV